MLRHPRVLAGTTFAALALGLAPQVKGQSPVDRPSPQSGSLPPGAAGAAGAGTAGGAAPGDVGAPAPGGASGTAAPPSGAPAGGTPATSPFAPPAAAGAGLDGVGAGPSPSLSSGLGGGLGDGGSYFGMLGDGAPTPRLNLLVRPGNVPPPPGIPRPGVPPSPPQLPRAGSSAAAVLPSVQQLKICENQSPKPQDRIYFTFNYFNNLNQDLNERLGSQITDVQVYRYVLGLEKTFLEGRASAGLRLPINNLSSTSRIPGFGGTSTAAGDLAAIFKYAVLEDRDTGSLVSLGLLVSTPTGPGEFAGARGFRSLRNTALTPFIGYILNRGDLYFQGFSSIEVPLDQRDVTVIYNDLGVGYYVYRAPEPDRFLSAVVPTFEVHVNTPVDHRGFPNPGDLFTNSYDVVNLTSGCNFVLNNGGVLTLGVVTPVTGPRPFDIEAIAQFNLRF